MYNVLRLIEQIKTKKTPTSDSVVFFREIEMTKKRQSAEYVRVFCLILLLVELRNCEYNGRVHSFFRIYGIVVGIPFTHILWLALRLIMRRTVYCSYTIIWITIKSGFLSDYVNDFSTALEFLKLYLPCGKPL